MPSPGAAAAIAAMEARAAHADLPMPDDLAAWDSLHEQQEAAVAPVNERTLGRYRPRLRTERAAGLEVLVVTPPAVVPGERRIVYLHGGGYTSFSARSSLFASVPLAHDLGLELWSIDYPRAPRSKCDATVAQVAAALEALLATAGHLLLVGDSAGGGLALAATLALPPGAPRPRALALWSPWCDVTAADVSHRWLAAADPVLRHPGVLERSALAYAPAERHGDPDVSPVHGDFDAGFPPTLIQCGTREILLSGCVRLYRRLDAAGCRACLDVYEGLHHSFQAITPDLPEAAYARRRLHRFFDEAVAESLR
ncbi:MAG: hypothetical protein CMLOHMNK_00346 [Steroidobacteraceae bacterium]|nr:hypothetical protein [Steroidobacteraceae bacterium]